MPRSRQGLGSRQPTELPKGLKLINNTFTCEEDGWFVSSFTNGKGSCVQVRFTGHDTVLVRDSKDRGAASPVLSVSSRSWASLLRNVSILV